MSGVKEKTSFSGSSGAKIHDQIKDIIHTVCNVYALWFVMKPAQHTSKVKEVDLIMLIYYIIQ